VNDIIQPVMIEQTILWRRLDSPGHDACALSTVGDRWRLSGTALFALEEQPCLLNYVVECDQSWQTLSAGIGGWIGRTSVSHYIGRDADGRWSFNGIVQPDMDGLVDLDLGFTPATNLIQFRRLSMAIGESVDAPVAWLSFPEMTFDRLEHRYHRVAHDRYEYEAPAFDYSGVLEVSDAGFVTRYPELWEMEAIEKRSTDDEGV
jgi:uncharacterized protein